MKTIKNTEFSLCMSVYRNDNPEDFVTAFNSVTTDQTCKPSEIVLVVDGLIPTELDYVITKMAETSDIPLNVIRFAENQGHAIARQTAIDASKYDLIAIMDSDDIAVPERFEKQIEYFDKHPETDVLGGQIAEFIGEVRMTIGMRDVPTSDKAIKQYLKSRCPMNFMTIMIKKDALRSVGGIIDWYCEEDYYLWIRMAMINCIFANLSDILVYARSGKAMYQRRGGWKYFQSERGIQRFMLTNRIISLPRYWYNVLGRFIIQVILPNNIRGFIYRTFFRKQNANH